MSQPTISKFPSIPPAQEDSLKVYVVNHCQYVNYDFT